MGSFRALHGAVPSVTAIVTAVRPDDGLVQVAANGPLHYRRTPNKVPFITGDKYVDDTTALLRKISEAAIDIAGKGKEPVYGTNVHAIFGEMVKGLNRPDLHVEQSFDILGLVKYGSAGSIRTDVTLGRDPENPVAVYDLKTGGAQLSESRAKDIIDV